MSDPEEQRREWLIHSMKTEMVLMLLVVIGGHLTIFIAGLPTLVAHVFDLTIYVTKSGTDWGLIALQAAWGLTVIVFAAGMLKGILCRGREKNE